MTKVEKMTMLRAIVGGFIVKEMPFTSVQIANYMKNIAVWIPNRHVAEFLRENVIEIADEYGIEYKVSNITVDTTKGYQTASCYHTLSFDPCAYKARDIRAITPDEFEAKHGMEAIVSQDEIVKKTDIFVNTSGRLEFKFPNASLD